MADDNVLRIGAEFDISPIVNAAKQGSTATQELGTTIEGLAARMRAQGMANADIVSGLINLQFSAKDANAAVASLGAESVSGTAELDGLKASVAALTAQVAALEAQLTKARGSMGGFSGASAQARVEMGALEGSAGMMASGLARVAAQASALRPLIEAAFPIFAAVAFIAVLDQMLAKIGEAIDEISGWDKAAQKAYVDAANANIRLIETNLEQQSQQQKQSEIGLEGIAKEKASLSDIQADIKRYTEAGIEARRAEMSDEQKLIELKREKVFAAIDPTRTDYGIIKKQIEETQRELDNYHKLREELVSKSKALDIEAASKSKEISAEATKDAIALSAAQAEATKTSGEAQVSAAEDEAKREYEAHKISIDQYVQLRKTAEEENFRVIQAAFKAQQSEVTEKQRTTGAPAAPELARLHGEEEAEETKHQQKLRDIDAEGDAERKKLALDRALAGIEADQKEIEAANKAAESYARIALKRADTPTEATAAELDLETRITKTYTDQVNLLKQKIDALTTASVSAHSEEIKTLTSEAVNIEQEREEKLSASRSESERLSKSYQEQIDILKAQATTISATGTSESSERVLSINSQIAVLEAKRSEALADEKAQADQVSAKYEEQISIIRQKITALQTADALTGSHSREITDLNAQIVALDAEKNEAIRTQQDETSERIKEMNKRTVEDQAASYSQQISLASTSGSEEIARINHTLELKKMSLAQYVQAVIVEAETEYTAKMDLYSKEIAAIDEAASKGIFTEEEATKRKQAIWTDELKAYDDKVKQEESATETAAKKEQATIEKTANLLQRSFETAFAETFRGQQSLREGFIKFYNDIENAAVAELEREIAKYITTEALKVVAHTQSQTAQTAVTATQSQARDNMEALSLIRHVTRKAEEVAIHTGSEIKKTASSIAHTAIREAAEIAAHLASLVRYAVDAAAFLAKELLKTAAVIAGVASRMAAEIVAHFQTMARYAAEAAAAVYAATAIIPIIGPILAPIAAAAAYAAVLAFQKGGIVPETGMAMVHEKEMVLPEELSTFVQAAAAAASAPVAGSTAPVLTNPAIDKEMSAKLSTFLESAAARSTFESDERTAHALAIEPPSVTAAPGQSPASIAAALALKSGDTLAPEIAAALAPTLPAAATTALPVTRTAPAASATGAAASAPSTTTTTAAEKFSSFIQSVAAKESATTAVPSAAPAIAAGLSFSPASEIAFTTTTPLPAPGSVAVPPSTSTAISTTAPPSALPELAAGTSLPSIRLTPSFAPSGASASPSTTVAAGASLPDAERAAASAPAPPVSPAMIAAGASFPSADRASPVPASGNASMDRMASAVTNMSSVVSSASTTNAPHNVRGDTHINISPREMKMTHEDIVRAVKLGVRRGEIRP